MTTARKLALLLLALDFIVVVAVFNAVGNVSTLVRQFVRHENLLVTLENMIGVLRFPEQTAGFTVLPLLVPLALVVLALYLIDGYNPRTDLMSLDYTSMHLIATGGALLGTLLLAFVFIPIGYSLQSSRAVIIISFIILAPLTLSYRRSAHARLERRLGRRCLVFLGDEPSCRAFREECDRTGTIQPVICTVVSEQSAAPFAGTADGIRPFGEVIEEVQSGGLKVEAIVLRETSRELEPDLTTRLVAMYFAGVPTFTLELFHQVYWRKIPLYRLNQTWLFQEGFRIAREPVFERVKRASDILLAAAGLVLAAPLIAVAGVLVSLEDHGPVFFRQLRVGRNRVKFPLVKLRTMRLAEGEGDLYTRADDPRITRIGRFLRSTRLDELPQLWNVLNGDMSLIGPRAEWDRLVEDYEKRIPCYYFRHLVKPGITGWAQVNYPYGAGIEDTRRKLEYDLYYIRYHSFSLDASIVLKTIHIMLFGKGR